MPPKPSPVASEWPWPFDEVELYMPDGSHVFLKRGDPIPAGYGATTVPDPVVETATTTPEES